MKTNRRKRFALCLSSFLAFSLLILFYRGEAALTKVNNILLAPNLTATKTGALDTSAGGDVNSNGVINPGDRLKYQVVINNSATDATGVNFSDTIDANTTYVAGSIIASPVAVNDPNYTAIGNVNISVPAANGLLANDLNPNGSGTLTIAAPSSTTNGGNLNVNATTGAFTYNPPVGFEGADTFSYTLSNGTGLTDTGVVTITVSGMVWFINNNAAACTLISNGCGRLTNPFSTLAALQAVNNGGGSPAGSNPAANDNIFIYESATAYAGGVTLLSGQKLIGQDATASLDTIAGITLANFPFSAALPGMNTAGNATAIQNSGGNAVTLNQSNIIRGLTVSGTSGAGITGTSIANLTVGADVVLTGIAGTDFDLSGAATGTIAFGATVTNTSGRSISIQNRTGGTANLTGAISDAGGTGIILNSNTGATITFSGGLSLSTGANAAFTATGGGTVNATQNNTSIVNTLTTTTGTALNVNATTIGASNLTFRSISSNGGANGIVLNSTGASGGLIVTGNGGTCTVAVTSGCTGGTIQNTSGADDSGITPPGTGIVLYNTNNVSLTRMWIHDNSNYGIRGTSNANGTNGVSGFALSNSIVSGVNGTNQATPFNDGSIRFDNLSGTSSISNSEVTGGYQRNIFIDNTIGALDLTVNANNIHNTSSAQGDDGLAIEIGTDNGAASATVHVTGNTFSAHGGDHFDFTTLGSPTVSVVFTGNNGNPGSPVHAIGLGQGFRIAGGAFNGTLTYDISNNTVNGTKQGNAITVNKGSGTGTFSGRVSGNTIGISGQTLSGASQSNGINVESRGGGTHTTLVTGNIIRQYREYGINIEGAEAGTTTFNATVTGNTIDEPGSPGAAGLSLHGIQLNWGIDVGNTSTACVDIGGAGVLKNNIPNSGNEPAGGFDIRSRQRQSTTVRLPGYTGANNDNAAVNAYYTGRNTLTSVSTTNTVPTGGGYTNTTPANSACPQPTVPSFVGLTRENANNPFDNSNNNLSFSNDAYQSPLAFLKDIQSSDKQFASAETISNREAVPANATVEKNNTFSTLNNPLGAIVSGFNAAANYITPTVSAQKKLRQESLVPSSGETVMKALGTLPAGESITVQFTAIVNSTPSNFFSVANTATISGANFTTFNSTTATNTVVQPVSISAAFGAPFINLNGTTSLTFTITNPNAQTQNGIAFSNTLSSGLVIATPNGVTNACGGTLTAVAGGSTISLSGGTRATGTCTVKVDVKGTTEGVKNISAGTPVAVTSTEGGTGNIATATITVINPPTLSKSFTPNQIEVNQTSVLQFTLSNQNTTLALNTITFTDALPSGVTAANVGATTICTDGSYSIASNVISFNKPTLAAGSNCVFSVTVTGTTAGVKTNTTSGVATANSNAGAAATATLMVVAVPDLTISKSHGGNFTQGQTGAQYTITVNNIGTGAVAAGNTVTVTDTLPTGLTATAIGGTGWSCVLNTLTCTGSNALPSGSSYPVITLTVNVAVNAPSSVTNTANVSGGGETNTSNNTASDPTTVNPAPTYVISGQITNGGQGLNGVTVTLSGSSGGTTTTDASGNYSFNNVTGGGNYTVTPSLNGYAFTPVNASFNNLAANQTSVNFATSAITYEGDVAGRSTGDGFVDVLDLVAVGRIIGNLDAQPAAGSEFQRADAAPRTPPNSSVLSLGDGAIDVLDLVQIGRYTASLDPLTPAGGPINVPASPVAGNEQIVDKTSSEVSDQVTGNYNADSVNAPNAPAAAAVSAGSITASGGTAVVPIQLISTGNVEAIQFTVTYDPAKLSIGTPLTTTLNNRYPNTTFTFNPNNTNGTLTVVANQPFDGTSVFPAGTITLFNINFTTAAGASGTTNVDFSDTPTPRRASDPNVALVTVTSTPGTVTLLSPTAAVVNLSGRVTTATGRGILAATVTLIDSSGEMRTARTNPFGYYRFFDVSAGETCVISASHKRYQFNPKVLSVTESLTEIDFTALAR